MTEAGKTFGNVKGVWLAKTDDFDYYSVLALLHVDEIPHRRKSFALLIGVSLQRRY